jgi:hypothetical protein
MSGVRSPGFSIGLEAVFFADVVTMGLGRIVDSSAEPDGVVSGGASTGQVSVPI